jgi:translation initiation factor eIF-2B subunit delta
MAPVWNAAIEAVAPDGEFRLARFTERAARAPKAITRFALELLRDSATAGAPLRLVTLSSSGTVVRVVEALHAERAIQLSCSESRPGLEGRRLATHLASLGIGVNCFTDAAIGQALSDADAVIVGADAVSPDWFMNKSGTRMLAAAASQQGVPVFVLASRDKFASSALALRLANRDGGASEIWSDAPPEVSVRNPYFERTPLELITAVVSDIGTLGSGMIPDACAAVHDAAALERIAALWPTS